MEDLKNKLSTYLNKPPNEALAKAAVAQFSKATPDAFVSFLNAIGIKQDDQVKEVITCVKEIVGEGGDEKESNNGSHNQLPLTKVKLSLDDELEELATKKQPRPITHGNDTESSEDDRLDMTKPKARTQSPSIDDELDDLLKEKPKSQPKFKNPPKFKKMKREDALRIKQDTPPASVTPTVKPKKTVTQPEEPALPSPASTLTEEEDGYTYDVNIPTNLEVDREWYNIDEESSLARTDAILEDSYTPRSRRPHQKPKSRQPRTNGSGGLFNEHGEYIDYDHSSGNEINKIPITSHVFIPPFLENLKQYLQLQISGNTIRGIGPTVDPVKDSTSELANMARQGSMVVQNRRSKNERALQAKEAMGVDDKVDDQEEDVTTDERPEEEQDIVQQRRSLPAFAVRDDLLTTIRDNQVTIVIGETGSGKTTQLTQFLYEDGFGANLDAHGEKKVIACTQPRRVAAMSVAKRVSEEMGCKLGEEVGYSIRFEDNTNPKKTVIKYMTEGILLREILVDPTLSNYSCIIMDEAHERSLNTDILLGLFKNLLSKRKDLKLIVTSATMNANRFTNFFGSAPQFTIPGRTFPVEVYFNKNVNMDYVENAVKQVLTIHLTNSKQGEFVNDGDILVFMTGQEDIEITCDLIKEKLNLLEDPPPLSVYPIYSTMPQDLQKKIFNKKNSRRRKVVVATNIAETSLTVDGIKYVIDCGLVKVKVYNPKLGMDTLQVVPISLANADQRSGRAGRTGPGVAYRLYTERATDLTSMYLQPIPEIQRTNLSNIMLMLKSLKVDDINQFPFLDSPPKDLLNCSLYDLWVIGALNNLGDLTKLGHSMTQFPIEPTLSKLILLSAQHEFHCSEEIVTIVAMLSVPNIYHRPQERANEADQAREKFVISESDHLTLLNVFNQWKTNLIKFKNNYSKINQWCNKNFLQLKSLYRAKDIKHQIMLIMKKLKIPIWKSRNDEDIKRCLCASFYQQLAKLSKMSLNGQPEFINLRHSYMKMYLHPTSCLLETNLSSNYIVYHELILTKKEYMNYVTCVDPEWLLEYGYKFYSVSDNYKGKVDESVIDKKKVFEEQLQRDKKTYEENTEKQTKKRVTNDKPISKPGSLFKKRRGF
ncbi:Pre-mRNA-splicing factor ATP-dependent RNA helicase prp16 [Candida viswanathii]|uniref:RNA helicase n=1 Tax=Candida viswanathii TaxID=5486 RepID=A0A367Y0A9_9ASCO|nr:Pre-mRNA-splicing factor ATP-dependent RNA helicase prp16 [Candida viswanathii]